MSLHSSSRTSLVTVTYGDRLSYLQELLRRGFENEKVDQIFLVSNASSSNLEILKKKWGERLKIINLLQNTGSANGYAVGIHAALECGSEYIWLMDDDNAPMPGALKRLHHALIDLVSETGSDKIAVLGFRPDHQADIAAGVPPQFTFPPFSSFFGFHVWHVPYKLWRRTPWGKPKGSARNYKRKISLPFAPYGGFLAHRTTFLCMGLPKIELVLYADDTEYTRRLTAKGGKIFLIQDALLEDLEGSWNLKTRYNNIFDGFLLGEGDRRVFYSSRNQAWFDCNCWKKSEILYQINRCLFLCLLHFFARKNKADRRLHLIKRAISDGEESRLGVHRDYPL